MSVKCLRIFQWNAHSIRNKKHEILNICHNFDILVLIETWLKPNIKFFLKDFSIVRNDRITDSAGGICICIRKNLIFKKIDCFVDIPNVLESLNIILFPQTKNEFLISAIYRPPNNSFNTNLWKLYFDKLNNFILTNNSKSFICGDFNCHNLAWEKCISNDNIGDHLLEQIDASDLILLNNGSRTFLGNDPNSISAVDLSFISSDLFCNCTWSTFDDCLSSDHLPIITNIILDTNNSSFHEISNKISFKNVDLSILQDKLCLISDNINEHNLGSKNIQEKYDFFIKSIVDSINSSKISNKNSKVNSSNTNSNSDIKKFRNKNISAPWWDEQCDKLIKERKFHLKNFLNNPILENWILFKKTCANTKKKLREIKCNKFKSFTESLSIDSPISYVWKIVKKFQSCVLTDSVQYINDFVYLNSSREFILEFCRPIPFITFPPSMTDSCQTIHSNLDNSYLETPFTMKEIQSALKNTKTNSSPGFDQISYKIIKSFPEKFLQNILDLLNEIFSKGIFAEDWNKYLMLLIPKSTPGKVRPIALASCFLKILEKMIHCRLNFYIEHNNLLSPTQFGFRRNLSGLDCLALLTSYIHLGFNENKFVVVLFLDIKGAFDSVNPNILIRDLLDINIPFKIRKFIFNLLSYRILTFKINNDFEGPFLNQMGVPQGNILSPINYNIYTRNANNHIENNCYLLQFADDTAIVCVDSDINKAISSVQKSINNLSKFFESRNLLLCPNKTKLLIFSKRKN